MISFFIAGIPASQGSKRHVGNGRMVEASKTLPEWRRTIETTSAREWAGKAPIDAPVAVTARFYLPEGSNG